MIVPELPFTAQEFFDVFGRYNRAVWPAQYLLVGVATLIVVSVLRRERPRLVLGLLAALWVWTGVVYHLTFFAEVNPAAGAFGAAFVVQAVLLIGAARTRRPPTPPTTGSLAVGKGLVAYALLGYPLVGYLAGHHYPETPTFGAPCPTTIFTLGILLWTRREPAWWLVAIPLLWTGLATVLAVQFSIPQDFGLAVAALATLAVLIRGVAARAHARPTPSASATRLM